MVSEMLAPSWWLVTSAARAIGSSVAEAPQPLTVPPPAASTASVARAFAVLVLAHEILILGLFSASSSQSSILLTRAWPKTSGATFYHRPAHRSIAREEG